MTLVLERTMQNLAACFTCEARNPWYSIVITEPVDHPRAAPTYSDQQLDYWGYLYQVNRLYARGILFEHFMQAPRDILQAVIYRQALPLPPGAEHYPLLPKQRRAAWGRR